jgi:hypothetical protein
MLAWVENGHAVFREDALGRIATERIHLYRLADGQRGTIEIQRPVPEAIQVDLLDVSVGKSGLVAIAANAVSPPTPTSKIVGLLLFYDTRGNLLSVQRMPEPGQRILRLMVDDADAVWAISRGTKSADPATEPLLYKYEHMGATTTAIYTRASVPEIVMLKPGVKGIGALWCGTTTDSVYCWVPELQEMLIMAKNGTGIRRLSMPATPPRPKGVAPETIPNIVRLYLTRESTAVVDVLFDGACKDRDKRVKSHRAMFMYDITQATWSELRYDYPPVVLVGIDGDRPVFMSRWKSENVQDSSYRLFKPTLESGLGIPMRIGDR